MSTKWRIYCTDISHESDNWQYLWSDTIPTVCPIDAEHTINENSITDITSEKLVAQILSNDIKENTTYFKKIGLYFYETINIGKIRRVKIIGVNSKSSGYFNIELYDVTNVTSLLTSANISNSTDENFITDLGVIENAPTTDFLLEINLKSNSVSNKIRISKILIFSENTD